MSVLCARSSNGTELMCCSWDGTVAYFGFSVDEIGEPMTLEEKVSCSLLTFSLLLSLI